MKIESQTSESSIFAFLEPEKREAKIKQLLLIFFSAMLFLSINSFVYDEIDKSSEMLAYLTFIALLYYFVTPDTTNLVGGMLIWSLMMFLFNFAWQNDGLFDTAIIAFPSLLIFAFVIGSKSLVVPLMIFMLLTLYFFAYSHYSGLIERETSFDESLWYKANSFAIILIISGFGLAIVSYYLKQLMNDLGRQVRKVEQIRSDARNSMLFDPLTELPNEMVCQEYFEQLKQANQIDRIFGLMTIDTKQAQWIYASLGHEIGDKVVRYLSKRLNKLMDEDKVLYRSSANEFFILVKAIDYEELSEFAHQIVQAVGRPFQVESFDIEFSGCVGISVSPLDSNHFTDLRKKSHTAVAKAKDDEENPICFFESEMESYIKNRMRMAQDLRRAIDAKEFELFYQPKVNLLTGDVEGAEALIRWFKNDEMVSPADFIPAAEESGLIVPIGQWALEQACLDCKAWHSAGYDNVSIAVNLSPVQFRRGNLPSIVFRALSSAGLDHTFLELEITESIFIDNREQIKQQIYQVANKGVTIAIDDFGTGYSNLNYLTKFNASTLKIDMSFVRNMTESLQNEHIVSAIIKMSDVMELESIAEGVEDEATATLLANMGCRYGQGFYWSKPLSLEQFIELLDKGF